MMNICTKHLQFFSIFFAVYASGILLYAVQYNMPNIRYGSGLNTLGAKQPQLPRE